MKINSPGTTKVGKVEAIERNRLGGSGEPPLPNLRTKDGFALVVALIMVALAAVIAVGVLTTVSVERVTATSYNSRYQADLAVQNGLQAAAKTLAASPNGTTPVTGKDTFLVVRADGPVDGNGNKAPYYYLAQPSTGTAPTITYYPLFSDSTNPSNPNIQTASINLAAADLPAVPLPVPPTNSNPTDAGAAWNAAGTQRLPTLYSWQQPNAPSGPSVKWVEMRDPQDTAPAPAHNLAYTRYSYWVEDLDGYLDASQVNDPNALTTRANGTSNGTSPGEIGMFTIFAPSQQTVGPTPAPVVNMIGSTQAQAQALRPLLLTVPTLQQVAYSSPSPAPSPDMAGPNVAVRLGMDNNPGEQNLIPLGYGYLNEGQPKTPINPVSQFGPNGNNNGRFGNIISAAMGNFANRSNPSSGGGGNGHTGKTVNYLNNLAANLVDFASPLFAPSDFMPPGNPTAPPSSRGIGAFPFVVSLYDLNNWVQTVQTGSIYSVVIETKTYVQLWNPHKAVNPADPNDGLSGALTVHYQNSDKVNVNGTTQTLSSPPDGTVIFTANPSTNTGTPAIVSPLFVSGNIGQSFNYQIIAATGYQDLKGKIKPNEYRVVALPAPTPSCSISGRVNYSASSYTCGPPPSGLPPGLSLAGGGRFAGSIRGTPTLDSCATYTGGYQDYNVQIGARTSCGNTPPTTLTIRIYR